MKFDFNALNFEILDANTNAYPDIFINQNGVTFTKKVLDDLNYPASSTKNLNGNTGPSGKISQPLQRQRRAARKRAALFVLWVKALHWNKKCTKASLFCHNCSV